MKTTVEISETLFRRAKSTAAQRGQTFKQFLNDAVREKLAGTGGEKGVAPWMKFFGAGKRYTESIRKIDREIEREFEIVEIEDRQ